MAANIPQIQSVKPLTQQEAQAAPLVEPKPSAAQSIAKTFANLTLREKVLLWALLIISLTLVLMFFLVMPANDRLIDAQANRSVLQTEQLSTQMTISAIPTNQATLENAQARYAEYLLMYQAPMYPEEVDRMLTNLIHDCGFTAAALDLNLTQVEMIGGFYPPEPSWQIPNPQAEQSLSAANESPAAGDDSADDVQDAETPLAAPPANDSLDVTGEHGVQVIEAHITVVGTTENFYALLDRVLPLSWIKITSTNFLPTGPHGGSQYEEACSISFKIYINTEAKPKQI